MDTFFSDNLWPIGLKILENLDTVSLVRCKFVCKKWLNFIESHPLYWQREITYIRNKLESRHKFSRVLDSFKHEHSHDSENLKAMCLYARADLSEDLKAFKIAAKAAKAWPIKHLEHYRDVKGGTALHFVVWANKGTKGHLVVKKILEQTKIDVNKVDKRGVTAIQIALTEGNFVAFRMIAMHMSIEDLASFRTEPGHQWTALHVAAFARDKALINYLFQNSIADTSQVSYSGRTAIAIAAGYKDHYFQYTRTAALSKEYEDIEQYLKEQEQLHQLTVGDK